MPSNAFATSVGANIAYWRSRIEALGGNVGCALRREQDNILRAVQFGMGLEETWAEALRLAVEAYPQVERHGSWDQWIPVLARATRLCVDSEPEIAVDVLWRLGQYQRLGRKFEAALETHGRELALATALNDDARRARAQLNLSQVYWRQRVYAAAEILAKQALPVFEAAPGLVEHRGATETILGLIAYGRGDMAEAIPYLERALATYRDMGREALQARSLMNLALAEEAAGLPEKALAHYAEALTVLASTKYELDKVRVELALGTLELNSGRFAEAEASFKRADSTFLRRSGLTYYQALLANNLGNVYFESGRLAEAEKHLRRSLDLWKHAGGRLMLGNTAGTLGQTLLAAGRPEEAARYLDRALEITGSFPDDRWAQTLHGVFSRARAMAEAVALDGET